MQLQTAVVAQPVDAAVEMVVAAKMAAVLNMVQLRRHHHLLLARMMVDEVVLQSEPSADHEESLVSVLVLREAVHSDFVSFVALVVGGRFWLVQSGEVIRSI